MRITLYTNNRSKIDAADHSVEVTDNLYGVWFRNGIVDNSTSLNEFVVSHIMNHVDQEVRTIQIDGADVKIDDILEVLVCTTTSGTRNIFTRPVGSYNPRLDNTMVKLHNHKGKFFVLHGWTDIADGSRSPTINVDVTAKISEHYVIRTHDEYERLVQYAKHQYTGNVNA